jgi:hypothetical protein
MGFEPATLTLAKKAGVPRDLLLCVKRQRHCGFSFDRGSPQLTVIVNDLCVFCGAHNTDFCTTYTTETASILNPSGLLGAGAADARKRKVRWLWPSRG